MKKSLVLILSLFATFAAYTAENNSSVQDAKNQPTIAVPVTNPDDPAYTVQPSTGYDGVVEIYIGESSGTGALLTTGRHILTAGHLWDVDTFNINPAEIEIAFNLPSGPEFLKAVKFTIHPGYDGETLANDIAIIELSETAPDEADRYEIYRQNDEVGKIAVHTGYGLRGTGFQGQDDMDPVSVLRIGENRYDALGDALNEAVLTELIPGTQLIFDFDNGNPANDAFGQYLGIVDLGLGAREVNTTQGDSGGPSFINNQIAGVVSYGVSPIEYFEGETTDIDEETNSSFGEFSSDTRVSFYAAWIDSVAGTSTQTRIEHFELY